MATLLDDYERYVVAYLRSDRAQGTHLAWIIARVLAALWFVYGFFDDDRAMIFAAFGTLLFIDLYATIRQPRFTAAIRSAIKKLEDRVAELENQQPAGS